MKYDTLLNQITLPLALRFAQYFFSSINILIFFSTASLHSQPSHPSLTASAVKILLLAPHSLELWRQLFLLRLLPPRRPLANTLLCLPPLPHLPLCLPLLHRGGGGRVSQEPWWTSASRPCSPCSPRRSWPRSGRPACSGRRLTRQSTSRTATR